MTGLELLEKKLVEDGYCKLVTEHSRKVIQGCVAILANADMSVYTDIRQAMDRLNEIYSKIRSKEKEARRLEISVAALQSDRESLVNKINNDVAYINTLQEALEQCETSEGRDRLRIAQMFINSVNIDTKYDNTAYIVGLSAILAGQTVAAIPTLKKLNKKLPVNNNLSSEWEDVKTV